MGKLGDIAAILGLGIVGGVLYMFASGKWKLPEWKWPWEDWKFPTLPTLPEFIEPIVHPKPIITPEPVVVKPVVPVPVIPVEPLIPPIIPTAPVVPLIPPVIPYPPRITPEEVVLPTLPSLAPVIIPREPRIPTGEWEEPWKMEPTPYWTPPPAPTITQTGVTNNGQITQPEALRPRIFERIVRGH